MCWCISRRLAQPVILRSFKVTISDFLSCKKCLSYCSERVLPSPFRQDFPWLPGLLVILLNWPPRNGDFPGWRSVRKMPLLYHHCTFPLSPAFKLCVFVFSNFPLLIYYSCRSLIEAPALMETVIPLFPECRQSAVVLFYCWVLPVAGVFMEIPLSRNLVKAGRGFCSALMNYAQRCTEPLSGTELVSSLLKPCQNIPPVCLVVPVAASDWSAWPCGV